MLAAGSSVHVLVSNIWRLVFYEWHERYCDAVVFSVLSNQQQQQQAQQQQIATARKYYKVLAISATVAITAMITSRNYSLGGLFTRFGSCCCSAGIQQQPQQQRTTLGIKS
jgi:hypothetical protein